MIRVLLADDEAMIRAGVAAILSADDDIEVVSEAGDGREAVEQARRTRPDVALVDIRMPPSAASPRSRRSAACCPAPASSC